MEGKGDKSKTKVPRVKLLSQVAGGPDLDGGEHFPLRPEEEVGCGDK